MRKWQCFVQSHAKGLGEEVAKVLGLLGDDLPGRQSFAEFVVDKSDDAEDVGAGTFARDVGWPGHVQLQLSVRDSVVLRLFAVFDDHFVDQIKTVFGYSKNKIRIYVLLKYPESVCRVPDFGTLIF